MKLQNVLIIFLMLVYQAKRLKPPVQRHQNTGNDIGENFIYFLCQIVPPTFLMLLNPWLRRMITEVLQPVEVVWRPVIEAGD